MVKLFCFTFEMLCFICHTLIEWLFKQDSHILVIVGYILLSSTFVLQKIYRDFRRKEILISLCIEKHLNYRRDYTQFPVRLQSPEAPAMHCMLPVCLSKKCFVNFENSLTLSKVKTEPFSFIVCGFFCECVCIAIANKHSSLALCLFRPFSVPRSHSVVYSISSSCCWGNTG